MSSKSYGEICKISFISSKHTNYQLYQVINSLINYEYNLVIKILEFIFIKYDDNNKPYINMKNLILFIATINIEELYKTYKKVDISTYNNAKYFYKNRFPCIIDDKLFCNNSFYGSLIYLLTTILEWYKQDYMLIHHLYLLKNTDNHKELETAFVKENNSIENEKNKINLFEKNKIPKRYMSSIKSSSETVFNHKKTEYIYSFYETKLKEDYTHINKVINKLKLI